MGPSLFIVESKTSGISVEPEPGMGVRAAGTSRLILEDVQLPATALLGGGEPGVYSECVALSRLAWCALAVGTGQAVLDYVTAYVKDRKAFGEPISNRQAVAFAVANIAIELDGLRLGTYRAAARVDQGLPFAREVALARRLCADRGMAIGSDGVQLLGGHGFVKEHPVERWYRDLRAAGMIEGGAARLSVTTMINLETPKKFNQLISQAHQVATEILRPNSRKYDTLEHEYPKELDMLAAAIDGLNEGGGLSGAGAGAVGSNGSVGTAKNDATAPTATAPTWPASWV